MKTQKELENAVLSFIRNHKGCTFNKILKGTGGYPRGSDFLKYDRSIDRILQMFRKEEVIAFTRKDGWISL